jgi:hypothetical protein
MMKVESIAQKVRIRECRFHNNKSSFLEAVSDFKGIIAAARGGVCL